MHALKRGKGGKSGARAPGSRFADRIVLPRVMRRPARIFAFMVSGNYVAPRHAVSAMTALLLAGAGIYGVWIGGQAPAYAQAVTARTGFAIDQVRVFGHRETSEIDILERLDLTGWTALVGFDADAARERIAAMPWIKSVEVRKIYPDAIEVRVEEREAFAIWQQGSQLAVVDRKGGIIVPFMPGRNSGLPLVIGYGAAEGAADFVEKIARFPELAGRVKGYIRVAQRRWDLRLDNGVTIKLPESGEDAAIAEVLQLDRSRELLSRDIVAVDLRQDDRLVVELSPSASKARQAALQAQAKAAKKKAGSI